MNDYEHISTLRSHDKSPDKYMRTGEWPKATTPMALLIAIDKPSFMRASGSKNLRTAA
jgi:hypothetical protein